MAKRKFKMPTAYTILFLLIILVAASTWFIPAGSYDYADGVPVSGTYHTAAANPQGVGDVLLASFRGFYDAVDVCVFILTVGGFLSVVMKTGAVDAGISNIIRRLNGQEKWLIPILMLFFGLGGTTYGMWEETMAFFPLLIPVFLAAGYDAVVGIAVILLGAGAGVICSTVNPFATGIAAGFAGVSLGEGILLRILQWIVFESAAIWFVMAYAARVKRDPSASVVGVGAGKLHVSAAETTPLSALFLVGGILVGLADRMDEADIAETFVAGCADLLGVAFIIGISRGITVLMNSGSITDTVLHWGESALSGAGSVAFTLLVYLIYLPLSVLIPSSSGLATLSVPILAPLAGFAGVGGELVVTAFQSASGLVNIVTPTAGVVMGALALGHVPYDRWFKFVWKLIVYFLLLTLVFLTVGVFL